MISCTGSRGWAPPRFQVTSRIARPIARFARAPPPLKIDSRVAIARSVTARPDTMTSGQQGCVVVTIPARLKRGSSIMSSAVSTTGKCSGRQPAMTALAATASTVAMRPLGGIAPSAWLAGRPDAATSRATTRRSGGNEGSPSVSPSR